MSGLEILIAIILGELFVTIILINIKLALSIKYRRDDKRANLEFKKAQTKLMEKRSKK